MKKKSLAPWIIMLILPWVLFFISLTISSAVRITDRANNDCQFQDSSTSKPLTEDYLDPDCDPSAAKTGSNILVLIFGIVGFIGLLGTPLWIIMLVKTSDHNKKLANSMAVTNAAALPDQPYNNGSTPSEQP